VVCIDNRIALQLGLKATDMQTLGVVGSEIQATVYAGSLEVPELNYKKTMPMFAPRKSSLAHPVLLGRSFLKDFIMTYDGPNGMFHFAEPYNFDPLNIDTA